MQYSFGFLVLLVVSTARAFAAEVMAEVVQAQKGVQLIQDQTVPEIKGISPPDDHTQPQNPKGACSSFCGGSSGVSTTGYHGGPGAPIVEQAVQQRRPAQARQPGTTATEQPQTGKRQGKCSDGKKVMQRLDAKVEARKAPKRAWERATHLWREAAYSRKLTEVSRDSLIRSTTGKHASAWPTREWERSGGEVTGLQGGLAFFLGFLLGGGDSEEAAPAVLDVLREALLCPLDCVQLLQVTQDNSYPSLRRKCSEGSGSCTLTGTRCRERLGDPPARC